MKLLLVFVACLVALPSAYGFLELVQPHGRGFTQVDNQRAPCGQSPIEIAGPRADWYADSIQEIEVLIHAAGGGGVLYNRFSCELNGDPKNNKEPLYPVKGGLRIEVPNRPGQIYKLRLRAPPTRCVGDGTMQLIYQTYHGQTYFQCTDLRIYHSGYSAGTTILANAFVAMLVGLLGVYFMF